MTILVSRNRRSKPRKRKPDIHSSAPIVLSGLTSKGESTLLFLRPGCEHRQVALGDIDVLNFDQPTRLAAWQAAPSRQRRSPRRAGCLLRGREDRARLPRHRRGFRRQWLRGPDGMRTHGIREYADAA